MILQTMIKELIVLKVRIDNYMTMHYCEFTMNRELQIVNRLSRIRTYNVREI